MDVLDVKLKIRITDDIVASLHFIFRHHVYSPFLMIYIIVSLNDTMYKKDKSSS